MTLIQSWNIPPQKTSFMFSCSLTHLPPIRSILSFSLGSSGLWSCVTSSAWSVISESFSFTPTTTAESPTWATYMWTPRITITLAVVPDVLGKPVIVFGHAAVREKDKQSIKWLTSLTYKMWLKFLRKTLLVVGVRAAQQQNVVKIAHYEELAMINDLRTLKL